MNKSILITGANSGLGKESARQLALKSETEKVILACRNIERAEAAKKELEASTGKKIFKILIMDVSNEDSVLKAVESLDEPVDALIMNAGGMGGKNADKPLPNGMNQISAQNLLGHVVLVDQLIKQEKLRNVVMFASSEAARGIQKMGMARPSLKSNSPEEIASVLDGSYFDKFDAMEAYGYVKYVGTLWISAMARKHPNIRFVSVSPGATSGTSISDSATGMMKFMFKYIMMPILMPMRGMIHRVEKGAKRYVDAISQSSFQNGGFYASAENKVIGDMEDQFKIFPGMANPVYQDNAYKALHRFIH